MKYIDEYRDPKLVKLLALKIKQVTKKNWTIMEICGGQTHSIMKYSLEEFLPENIQLVHGPGCPVCVTPLEIIDKAVNISLQPDVILTSFGDMLRVPGSGLDLLSAKALGADVRMVYSPLDAVSIAASNPNKKVVFFAVGFETTAPANALAVSVAKKQNLNNFYILSSHVLVPPAIEAIMSAPEVRIHAFLAAGHVCTVMGYHEYIPLTEKYKIPIVVTGFEPVDILQGILAAVEQLESGRYELENQYSRNVKKEGNIKAQELLKEVFDVVDRKWRGIGLIPKSGLNLNDKYSAFDAEKHFDVKNIQVEEPLECISGSVLQGLKKPFECSAFGTKCTPEKPLGAPMVSTEGACAAYFHYKKTELMQN